MTDAYIERQVKEYFLKLRGLKKTIDGAHPDVSFENEEFARPDDGYWYEVYFIPSSPQQIELGTNARSRWIGLLQVNICTPKSAGTTPSLDRYESIAEHFRSGMYINRNIRIVKTSRSSAIEDGDFYVMPVTVELVANLDR